jgi:hypothetical protein
VKHKERLDSSPAKSGMKSSPAWSVSKNTLGFPRCFTRPYSSREFKDEHLKDKTANAEFCEPSARYLFTREKDAPTNPLIPTFLKIHFSCLSAESEKCTQNSAFAVLKSCVGRKTTESQSVSSSGHVDSPELPRRIAHDELEWKRSTGRLFPINEAD